MQTKIEQALGTVPEKCRQVFEMSRYQGMKYRGDRPKTGYLPENRGSTHE
ncbi:MAG: sigma factor-like helix-turn-helix DNA-binding protein [Saprospiraceae bacterium]